jgi:hypothetical protein
LGNSLASLLNFVLNKILQGSELRLAATTSVHIILICNKPTVRRAGSGGNNQGPNQFALQPQTRINQGWHQNQVSAPALDLQEAAENTFQGFRARNPRV